MIMRRSIDCAENGASWMEQLELAGLVSTSL